MPCELFKSNGLNNYKAPNSLEKKSTFRTHTTKNRSCAILLISQTEILNFMIEVIEKRPLVVVISRKTTAINNWIDSAISKVRNENNFNFRETQKSPLRYSE